MLTSNAEYGDLDGLFWCGELGCSPLILGMFKLMDAHNLCCCVV